MRIAAELGTAPVATTLARIENDRGYDRGRFGFYQQFDRDTGERLDDDAARDQPAHTVFRLDVDVLALSTDTIREFDDHSCAYQRAFERGVISAAL